MGELYPSPLFCKDSTENLVFLDVAGRVAAVLLELATRYGAEHSSTEIGLHLTQAEFASWVCASREMVNRVLHAYQNEGLIAMKGRTILVLDPNGLRHKTVC